jgi:sulfur-carrier protein
MSAWALMRVHIPQPLLSYTQQLGLVEAEGATVGELISDLDRRYPGLRFRIVNEREALRPHVRVFVNRRPTARLDHVLAASDEVHILQALSGG